MEYLNTYIFLLAAFSATFGAKIIVIGVLSRMGQRLSAALVTISLPASAVFIFFSVKGILSAVKGCIQ